jgi:hypothetical protein
MDDQSALGPPLIAPSRIGSGGGTIVGGVLLIILAGVSQVLDYTVSRAFGPIVTLLVMLGASLVTWGVVVDIAHRLELRLIDLQRVAAGVGPREDLSAPKPETQPWPKDWIKPA